MQALPPWYLFCLFFFNMALRLFGMVFGEGTYP